MVEVQKFNTNEPDILYSDKTGDLTISDVNNKSFPLKITQLDGRYISKTITMTYEDVIDQIILQRKETVISGGVMDKRDNNPIEECLIRTDPSVGESVETDEGGKFELASNNFKKNTSYRIIIQHRDYKNAEWTGIQPTINSFMSLGWKRLEPLKKLKVTIEDTLKLHDTDLGDEDGVIFDD